MICDCAREACFESLYAAQQMPGTHLPWGMEKTIFPKCKSLLSSIISAKSFNHKLSPPPTICEVFNSTSLVSWTRERGLVIVNPAAVQQPIFSYSVPLNLIYKAEESKGQVKWHCTQEDLNLALQMPGVESGRPLTTIPSAAAIRKELSSTLWLQLVPVSCNVPPDSFIHDAVTFLSLHNSCTWKVIQATVLLQTSSYERRYSGSFPAAFAKLNIFFLCTHAVVTYF